MGQPNTKHQPGVYVESLHNDMHQHAVVKSRHSYMPPRLGWGGSSPLRGTPGTQALLGRWTPNRVGREIPTGADGRRLEGNWSCGTHERSSERVHDFRRGSANRQATSL